jgi:hypothetical protein
VQRRDGPAPDDTAVRCLYNKKHGSPPSAISSYTAHSWVRLEPPKPPELPQLLEGTSAHCSDEQPLSCVSGVAAIRALNVTPSLERDSRQRRKVRGKNSSSDECKSTSRSSSEKACTGQGLSSAVRTQCRRPLPQPGIWTACSQPSPQKTCNWRPRRRQKPPRHQMQRRWSNTPGT